MTSIFNYQQEITNCNPNQQVIEVSLHSRNWERFFTSYPVIRDIFQEIAQPEGRILITRNEVRNSAGQHRIINALIWAFADKPRVPNLNMLLPGLDNIVTLLEQHQGDDLHEEEFKDFYSTLHNIPGVGDTTASILIYFCNIKCEGCVPIAITSHITSEFCKFIELQEGNNLPYYEQLYRFNEIATNLGVSPERIEYFLYRVNKGEILI